MLRASHEAFAQAALTVVSSARFRPAVKDGRPVRVRIRLPITMRSRPSAAPMQPTSMGGDVPSAENGPKANVASITVQ